MAIVLPELVAASAVLDPTGKALLNLWLHRDLGDERIAELIGSTPERVTARRGRVLETLAYQLDTTPENVREAIDHIAQQPRGAATPAEPVEASSPATSAKPKDEEAAAPPSAAARPPSAGADRPARGRRRSGLAALALIAAIGLIAVLLAATGSGGSAPPKPARLAAQKPATQPTVVPRPKSKAKPQGPARAKPKPKPHRAVRPKPVTKPAAKEPRVVLRPLPGAPANARGLLTLERHRGRTFVRLQLTGLPPRRGTYRLWLYNSVLDARPLADASRTGGFFGPLPRINRQFRYLDVSAQDPGSRFHSGQSVLRVRLARPARRTP